MKSHMSRLDKRTFLNIQIHFKLHFNQQNGAIAQLNKCTPQSIKRQNWTNIPIKIMKLSTCVLVLIVKISIVNANNSRVLDYPLQIIEYLIGEQTGTFESIFVEVSSQTPYDNILSELLQSPQLQFTTKYVFRNVFQVSNLHEFLPKNPSLLVIQPGRESDFFSFVESGALLPLFYTFNPATKVLVFVDRRSCPESAEMGFQSCQLQQCVDFQHC